MTSLAIDVRSKTFANGVCAIRGLTFTAQRGEFVAIVGPSGAGKTTLLHLIAGLDTDMQGEVSIGVAGAQQRQPKIGFLFQEPRLMPWLTAYNNIKLVLKPYAARGKSTGEAQRPGQDAQLEQLLELVGLKGCGDMYPGQLSGGMNRRVALLRAFIIEPDLLLMDEPFQSLDLPTANQLRSLLTDLWQRTSPTVLFVTHDLREALSLSDRVLFVSARPARVILDYIVPLPRPRASDSGAVQQMQQQLLCRYPHLLEGSLSGMAAVRHDSNPCIAPRG